MPYQTLARLALPILLAAVLLLPALAGMIVAESDESAPAAPVTPPHTLVTVQVVASR